MATLSQPAQLIAKRKPGLLSSLSSKRSRREAAWFYVFITPWLLGFVFLSIIPLIFGFYISLTNYDGINLAHVKFIGFANYLRAFNDRDVLFALGRTAMFALISVPLNLSVAFIIALILTRQIFLKSIFRTLFYIPSIMPIVAASWIWKALWDNNFGLVNGVLSAIWPGTAVRWMTEFPTETLIMLSLWISTGGAMIIFMAGIQGVPKELEEAALIDGAGYLRMFGLITLPLVSPVIFYQLVLAIIFSLQVLVEPLLLGAGGTGGALGGAPPRANLMYMVNTYQQIFSQQRFGYGSALLWLLFVLVLLLTLIVFRTSRYWVYYEVDQEGARK